jgi:hypothetical protein
MGRKTPRNDDLILSLLESGRIVVKEDPTGMVECGEQMVPKTKVYVRDARSRSGDLREQTMHPNIGYHPYFSIYPDGRKGGMVWLSARRVVWYAFNPKKTGLMVCPIDGDPWNYNIRNLCLRDQNEENYIRMMNKERPQEKEDELKEGENTFPLDDDIPF